MRCNHDGCTKDPGFGVEGTGTREFCSEHKGEGMVDLRIKNSKCSHHGCTKRASFGVEKAEFCSEHKGGGMVNTRKCNHHGCTKRSYYGVEGTRKVEFCSNHKGGGMVNLWYGICKHRGCTKRPCFGLEGTRKVEFCSEHKGEGMVDLVSRKCRHHGCTKYPRSRFGTRCSEHKMVDSAHKRGGKTCNHDGCTISSFGVEGSTKREFCSEHKGEGPRSRFGTRRCSEHKMVDSAHERGGKKTCNHDWCPQFRRGR